MAGDTVHNVHVVHVVHRVHLPKLDKTIQPEASISALVQVQDIGNTSGSRYRFTLLPGRPRFYPLSAQMCYLCLEPEVLPMS
jgi:hypothetical protein